MSAEDVFANFGIEFFLLSKYLIGCRSAVFFLFCLIYTLRVLHNAVVVMYTTPMVVSHSAHLTASYCLYWSTLLRTSCSSSASCTFIFKHLLCGTFGTPHNGSANNTTHLYEENSAGHSKVCINYKDGVHVKWNTKGLLRLVFIIIRLNASFDKLELADRVAVRVTVRHTAVA